MPTSACCTRSGISSSDRRCGILCSSWSARSRQTPSVKQPTGSKSTLPDCSTVFHSDTHSSVGASHRQSQEGTPHIPCTETQDPLYPQAARQTSEGDQR